MPLINLVAIIAILIVGCNESRDMSEIYSEHKALFKKIEDPIKTDKRYFFEKDSWTVRHSVFDSTYLTNIKQVFESTSCDLVYISDGDVFVGRNGNVLGLCFTRKNSSEVIEMLNFRGSLKYLLKNGKSKTPPFAIKIASNWYVMSDIQSL